ncbi:MAG: flavin reductase family protein [Marinifilaceae bacterium]
MQEVNPLEYVKNPIKIIAQDWMLVTAGTKDKFNTMTASWGGVGFLWNKPVAFVFVRPERYTYQFIEQSDYLTLSFMGEQFRKELMLLGTKSGRDTDKITESGLTPFFTAQGNPAFAEAHTVMECRKLFKSPMTANQFIDTELIDKWYGAKGNFHHMYVVEIEHIFTKE